MKHLFIAGNWKSNKTVSQAKEWASAFLKQYLEKQFPDGFSAVVCAPYLALPGMSDLFAHAPTGLSLCAQDVSPFEDGAYTGEVSASMIRDVAKWVLIGHSERRKYFGETDEMLTNKVERAKSAGLSVIYCVQDDSVIVPAGVDVVAYEPVWAIGTGKTDTPQNAASVVSSIKSKTGVGTVIYGGSVKADNVVSFVSEQAIDGVLPGGASLDPAGFFELLANAASVA